ncbi:hypothetical protein CTI12_AA240860 [Artemisia annua]|uniref:SWIM-type domain-containing protein n=1 Tax=Artemisia annua TaxID=35608 RepID=A0A2U1NQ96_ARTAN|nr:hypothetical protein CTI12_AA240860 [Artemisia annua]
MEKSASWKVLGIEMDRVYEVRDTKRRHVVDLEHGECTCRQWQLSSLPCGYVCAVARFAGLTSVKRLAKAWFYNKTLKGTYEPIIYPLKDTTMWETPDHIQQVAPPLVNKRQACRPQKNKRIPSQGEVPIRNSYGRCGRYGHNRRACNTPLVTEKVTIIHFSNQVKTCYSCQLMCMYTFPQNNGSTSTRRKYVTKHQPGPSKRARVVAGSSNDSFGTKIHASGDFMQGIIGAAETPSPNQRQEQRNSATQHINSLSQLATPKKFLQSS